MAYENLETGFDVEVVRDYFKNCTAPADYDVAAYIPAERLNSSIPYEGWLMQPYPNLAGYAEHARDKTFSFLDQLAVFQVLKAIKEAENLEKGVLLTRYFPPSLCKTLLLQPEILDKIDALCFQCPSHHHTDFFSSNERGLIHDLYRLNIDVYWLPSNSNEVLLYTERRDKITGLFVPADKVEEFSRGCVIGVYGSHLISGDLENCLRDILKGLLLLKQHSQNALLNPWKPLALLTGGGPGVMEVANRIAFELGILSCAHTVDFSTFSSESKHNPFVEARMTYRLEELIERQSDFRLDFPIFSVGGYGTDFELALEEAERKVHPYHSTPVILLGPADYWRAKITNRFRCNIESGTIRGSEWVSNCFYCVDNALEALEVYTAYAQGFLGIGKDGPVYEEGFCIWPERRI